MATSKFDGKSGILTEDNYLYQSLFNLAELLEDELQVNGIDPSFSERVSKQKSMINLSYPGTNPLYPFIVVERITSSGDPQGMYQHVLYTLDFNIKVVSVKTDLYGTPPTSVERLKSLVAKVLKNNRDTLHAYKLEYHPTQWNFGETPAIEDPDFSGVFFGSLQFRYFTIIVEE